MAGKSVLYNIIKDLVEAMTPVIGRKYIFLDRPNTSDKDKPMSMFAVIDLPAGIEDFVIGTKKTYMTTAGIIYLFVHAKKDGTLELEDTGDITDKVINLFPIKGKYCSATKPVVRLSGNDGHGYQVVTITFDLQTKWRAFD